MIAQNVHMLGALSKGKDVTFYLGSAGKIVEHLTYTGAPCVIHRIRGKENVAVVGANITVVECNTWGTRMDCFLKADGYLFFWGRAGTMAHLVPIIAHIQKKLEKQEAELSPFVPEPARRVALIGWPIGRAADLVSLMELRSNDVANWIKNFATVKEAFEFLTAGPK